MRRLVIGLAVIAVLAWLGWRFALQPRRERAAPVPADTLGTGYRAVRLFFAAPSGDGLVGESREIPEATDLRARVAALVSELDRGPRGPAVAALPPGTSLLHVYLNDEGLMTVDLSRAFQQGFRGGSTSEYLAVSSLVRTLAANVPEARRVLLVCGGEPITSLGGHLPLDRPIDVRELP